MGKCQVEGCTVKYATYNYITSSKGMYCSKHKLDDMKDVVNSKCMEFGCRKRPSFGIKGTNSARYCALHKKENMIDMRTKICEHQGCEISASFNVEGSKIRKFCTLHKEENMVAIGKKTCEHPNCKKIPSFGEEGNVAKFCAEHKLEGMIDLTHKKCEHPGCSTQSVFGNKGDIIPKFCVKHKTSDMIDIKSRTCKYDGCLIHPSYGNINDKIPSFCLTHKLETMVNIVSPQCLFDGCTTRPNYGLITDKRPTFCVLHKSEHMEDLIHNKCKTPLCSVRVNPKYDGYCTFCFIHMFPDLPNARNYKTKESSVLDHIKSTFKDVTIISDRKIKDGCSLRRPDILIDLGYQLIIIEVDEFKHEDYECSCENKRIMEISQDVGHRPIIFLRFNPDSYLEGEKEIKSCWKLNKQGFCAIRDKEEWKKRLDVLSEQVQYWLDNKLEKTVEVIQLYYGD